MGIVLSCALIQTCLLALIQSSFRSVGIANTIFLKSSIVFKLYNLEWKLEVAAHIMCPETRSGSWNSNGLTIPI